MLLYSQRALLLGTAVSLVPFGNTFDMSIWRTQRTLAPSGYFVAMASKVTFRRAR